MRRSIRSLKKENLLRDTHAHLIVFRARVMGNLNHAWVGWEFEPELSSPSGGINVFYL